MNRRLILIANNGTKDNYLPGVSIDMHHYREYFTKAEGGAWRNYEIKEFDNNGTKDELKRYIDQHKVNVDYFQIVFCGHGYAMENKDTVLELSPDNECSVSDIKSWLQGKYVLLIVDCCRKVPSRGTNIQDSLSERLFCLTESARGHYFDTCRKIFDNSIDNIRKNYLSGYFAEAYSCSLGECAHEDDTNGGYYTYCLLCQALDNIKRKKELHFKNKIQIGFFSSVHDPICPKVNELSQKYDHEPQNPTRNKGCIIPFYVVPSEFNYV